MQKYEGIREFSEEQSENVKEQFKVSSRKLPLFDLGRADRLMEGAIDTHIHMGPDAWSPRVFNSIEIGTQACERGMAAVIDKCHSAPSARSSALAQQAVDQWAKEHGKRSTKVIGGVVLNYPVGGLNAEAVLSTAKLGGRIVWTPQLDSSHDYKLRGEPGGIAVIDKNGEAMPEFKEIFRIIVEYDMVLSLAHQGTRERLILIDAAKEAGVKRISCVHVTHCATIMSPDQMKMVADKGAYLELCCLDFHPPLFSWDGAIEAIKKVGADHFVLGTDLGHWTMPAPVTAYRAFLGGLLQRGIPEADVRKMASTNAMRLIF